MPVQKLSQQSPVLQRIQPLHSNLPPDDASAKAISTITSPASLLPLDSSPSPIRASLQNLSATPFANPISRNDSLMTVNYSSRKAPPTCASNPSTLSSTSLPHVPANASCPIPKPNPSGVVSAVGIGKMQTDSNGKMAGDEPPSDEMENEMENDESRTKAKRSVRLARNNQTIATWRKRKSLYPLILQP
ncbi:hypothetical protein NE237_000062 [Protea cynaroides]|uniref:Uncharacterized protein n=1 Tax=Protea cynaroides TaxID=273540 RepID=A0A9Q0GL70_9MAGN|nr:hypothetical protein NE237_000062 [Protea cynaroides]